MPVARLCSLGLLVPLVCAALFAQGNESQGQKPILKIGGPVSAPQLIHKVEPEYSEEARNSGLEGTVVLYIVVDESGAPRDFKVVRSVGKGLDEKAIEAVQKWRFKPGMKDGVPVNVAAQIEVNFRLFGRPLEQLLTQAYELKPEGLAALENGISAAPGDVEARIQLLAFYTAHPNADNLESARETRCHHLFWLIENAPYATVLDHSITFINRAGEPLASEALFERGRLLWAKQVEAAPDNPIILEHAARYLSLSNKDQAEQLLLRAANKNPKYSVALGELYALSALGVSAIDLINGTILATAPELRQSDFAKRAVASIEASTDTNLIAGAADTLARGVRDLKKNGSPSGEMQLVCQRTLDRAESLHASVGLDCEGHQKQVRVRVGSAVQASNLISKVSPAYPPEAKRDRVSGIVRFEVVVGTDGLVKNLKLIGGPPLLVQSAAAAVRQWKYKPTLLNGKPVEVQTQVDVNFEIK